MRVLITGAKSAKAFAFASQYAAEHVFLADYEEVPQIPIKDYTFLSMGTLNPDTVAHSLLSFCLDHAINILVPVYDFEIQALVRSTVLFEEFDIKIILPHAF